MPSAGIVAQQPAGNEKYLFEQVNLSRARGGLPALKWDAKLAEAARRHTELMAEYGELSHELPAEAEVQVRAFAAGARFSMIAENIAEGDALEDLHYGWMHSPPHRANILSPILTSIGIAVQKIGKRYYATQDFSRAVADLSLHEQENRIGKLIEARGLRVTLGPEDARRACRSEGSYPGPHPREILHFETPDLTKLPDSLEKLIATHGFRTATVGACEPAPAGGFSRYRFAVLLD
jgi:Cysteine-rich secretory protein family